MTVFKFRAWGKERGKENKEMWPWSHFKGFFVSDMARWIKDRGLVIMQSTGMRDSEETEIYEGDILKNEHYMTAVGWHEEYGQWHCESNRDYDVDRFSSLFIYLSVNRDSAVVIGNIHENPDLLEKIFSNRENPPNV